MGKKLIPALLIGGGVVVVAALAAWVFLHYKFGRQTPAPPGPKVANVVVETVRALPQLPDVAELPAVIEPGRIVTVSAEVAGRVEKLAMEEGATCKAGQLLVVLNSELLKADRDGAKARAKLAELAFLRTEKLQKAGAARGEELEIARAARDATAATLAAAETRLKRARITAPIAGVLDDLSVEKGEYVTAGIVGTAVARIVDSSRVKAVVMIPERDAQYIKVGTPAEVICEIKGRKHVFVARVTYLSELADRATRAARAEVTVDNKERLLRGGRIVTVRLTRRVLKDVIMVPLTAVIPLERGHVVYVAKDGKAVRREVRLDTSVIKSRKTRKKVQYVRILEGLSPGDRLIVKGQAFVGPGQPVSISTQEKTPGAARE